MTDHGQRIGTRPGPDFFLVGAPKSGTTSMCKYLKQHPSVFIPVIKEPLFFGSDLTFRSRVSGLEEYLRLFEKGWGRLCGEGSVWYLFSEKAAQEIYRFNPDARIIIMVRNPVDFMYSLHGETLFSGRETITDFEEALAAEPARKQGKRLAPGLSVAPESLFYTEAARFTEQIRRYFDVFERDHIHVILFDDFKQDADNVFRETLAFLGLSPDVRVGGGFRVFNQRKTPRSRSVQWLLRSSSERAGWYWFSSRVLPCVLRYRVKAVIEKLNSRPQPATPMNPAVRKRLQVQFTPEVETLSALIERDLTGWTRW